MSVSTRFFCLTFKIRRLSIPLGALLPLMFSLAVHAQAPALPNLPLSFEPNRGQANHDSLFVARTPEGEVSLRKDGFGLSFAHDGKTGHLRAKFVGMNPASAATGEDAGKGVANYYRGQDPSGWVTNVPLYNKVRYSNAYPLTDLVYHASRGRLEYDLELQPGAGTGNLSIEFTGVQGIHLDRDGNLVVQAGGQEVRMLSPVSYQTEDGKRIEVTSRYKLLSANRVGISLGQYNRSERLVIDPVVAYASFLNTGVTTTPVYSNIAVDSEGNAYLGAIIFPQGNGTSQQFLIKVDSTGAVVFQNVIAGALATLVTTDPKGNVYIAGGALQGFTSTANLLPPCDQDCGGTFIAKFSPSGTMVYSTLVSAAYGGGNALASIVANANGNVYFTGGNVLIQPVNAFQSGQEFESIAGSAYFGELSADGTAFVFASYLGVNTLGNAIAVDQAGDVYVAGTLNAAPYEFENDPQYLPMVPLKGEFEAFPGYSSISGTVGGFLCKFAPDGKTLLFGTALDGEISGMAVGPDNSVYLVGESSITYSTPFTLGAYSLPITLGGSFAMALNPTLTGLTYSTSLNRDASAMALDGQGDLYLAGTSTGGIQPNANAIESNVLAAGSVGGDGGTNEGFYLELDPKGNLVTSPYDGGPNTPEIPQSIAVDAQGDVYLAGSLPIPETGSNGGCQEPDPVTVGSVGFGQETQFTNCYSTSPGQDAGGFITKILPANQPQISLTPWLPALELRNVGSADLHISSIAPSGGLAKVWGNCGSTVAAGTACSLTLTDSNGNIANGSVTITSDAEPNVQTFTPIAVANVGGVGGVIPWVDASQLSFGPLQNGVPSAPQPITIVNAGTLPLVGTTVIAIAPFTATNNCPANLQPGASCTGQVVWTPGNGIPVPGAIYVGFGDAPGESFNPNLSIISPNALLTIPADGDSMVFPTENIGDAALYRTVTVMNVGAGSMAAPSATLSGDSEFTIVGNTCTTSLAPQQTCGVAVLFTPTAVGTPQATLTISGGGATATIPLSGTGQNPVALGTVTVTPALNFGTQPIGQMTTQSAVIKNTGNIALSVSYEISAFSTFPGDSYSAPSGLCATIAPGTSCSIPVSFTPTGGGPQGATLSISDNAVNFAQSVALTGVGAAPAVTLSYGAGWNFGNQDEGTTSAGFPITLTNSGSEALAITSIAASTDLPSQTQDFSEKNNCGASVAVGASCTITAYFSPTVAGSENGEVVITDNAPDSPQGVSLMGTGTVPGVTLGAAKGGTINVNVSPGQTAVFSLAATASEGFSGQVTLSCSSETTYGTCTVSPSVVTLTGGSSAPFSLSVTTESTSVASLSTASNVDRAGLGFLGLLSLPLLLAARIRMKRMNTVLLVLLIGVIFASFSGCGGGGGSSGGGTTVLTTPPGSYYPTVTATGNFPTVTEIVNLGVS